MEKIANKTAHFMLHGVKFMLTCVSDADLTKITIDPETGVEKVIEGYPMYFTPSGRLYPIPTSEIEVIYG